MVIYILRHGLALQFTGVLVKTEMNSAIDTCVGNIVGDLSEIGIIEYDARYSRVLKGDQMPKSAILPLEDLPGRI